MVTANEIEAYKGDSALSGGLGDKGLQIVANSQNKAFDTVNSAIDNLNRKMFLKSQTLYNQRIKDRDNLGELIKSKELDTSQMEDDDRLRMNAEIQGLRDEMVSTAKGGKISDAEAYLKIISKYKDIQNQADNAKLNYLTRQGEIKANAELYDPNSNIKTISKSTTSGGDENGVGATNVSEQTSIKGENVRRLPYNVEGFKKHDEAEKAKMKADPYYKYQPFVPLSNYDRNAVFQNTGVETTITKIAGRKERVETKPSWDKTKANSLQEYSKNPRDFQLAQKELLLTDEGQLSIFNANKKLTELNEKEKDETKKIALISPTDDPLIMFTKLNYTQGYDNAFSKTEKYADKFDAAMAVEDNQGEQTRKSQNNAGAIASRQSSQDAIEARRLENLKAGNTASQSKLEARLKRENPTTTDSNGDPISFSELENHQEMLQNAFDLGKIKTTAQQTDLDNLARNIGKKVKGLGTKIKIREINKINLSPKFQSKFEEENIYMIQKEDGSFVLSNSDGSVSFDETAMENMTIGSTQAGLKKLDAYRKGNQSSSTPKPTKQQGEYKFVNGKLELQ